MNSETKPSKKYWLVIPALATLLGLTLPLAAQDAKVAQDTEVAEAEVAPEPAPDLRAMLAKLPWLEADDVRAVWEQDPGDDPDPDTVWIRESGQPFRIQKWERRYAIYRNQPEGFVKPRRGVNFSAEIYRQDEEWVWIWYPITAPRTREFTTDPDVYTARGLRPDRVEWLKKQREGYKTTEIPRTEERVTFVESSTGLPTQGSWRNSAAVADMNEDGHLDIVTPPQRGGTGSLAPYIFLGNGKGEWTKWQEARWPRGSNYGSVVVADLNKDGHKDLVFGVHLRGLSAFLGDGKGTFVDSSDGLPDDFPSRRALVADVDGDGWQDIVGLSEGPTMHGSENAGAGSLLRVYLNKNKGTSWQEFRIAARDRKTSGDWLVTGDFNGDGMPDFAGSSVYFNASDLLYVTTPDRLWSSWGRDWFPAYSYYFEVEAGRFSSKEQDDAIFSFTRFWPMAINPEEVEPPKITGLGGLEMVSFRDGQLERKPIVVWEGSVAVYAMAKGDFNHDGNLDLVFITNGPREARMLLGNGKGEFREVSIEGVDLPPNKAYEITVADFDRDGREDLLILFEDNEKQAGAKNGAVKVWLNRGAK